MKQFIEIEYIINQPIPNLSKGLERTCTDLILRESVIRIEQILNPLNAFKPSKWHVFVYVQCQDDTLTDIRIYELDETLYTKLKTQLL